MKRILIIEDDPIVGHIYRTRLEKEGFEIEVCADGQAGFYRTHEYQPDAVLLDLMLPKMNGIDILKKLRAEPKFQRLPVVVFTNAYVPNMIQEAFSAGASQVFNKATLTPRQILDALFVASEAAAQQGSSTSSGPPPEPVADDSPAPAEPAAEDSSTHAQPAAYPPQAHAPIPHASPEATQPTLTSDDSGFQSELTQAFLQSKHETLLAIRKSLQEFSRAQDDTARAPHLFELYRKVHALTSSAGIAGFTSIAQMASALEVLLKELHEKPKNINISTLRTVAHSVDFISELFAANEPDPGEPPASNILVVGGALGCEEAARSAVQDIADEIRHVREYSAVWPQRPRVYFEEWMDPLIAGIRWVSEIIEIAGGRDVFAELRDQHAARSRVVMPDAVVERDPEIILASWCGKPVDPGLIACRPGWERIAAVRAGRVHEIDGADILAPGPSLMVGLRRIHEIIQAFQSTD